MKGAISKRGYLTNSPDRKNDFNIVPSNRITMKGVNQDLKLIPIKFPEGYTGDAVTAKPGKEYKFPGYNMVLEMPTKLMEQGGTMNPYSQVSQVPVMPYYNTSPQNGFQAIMAYGGSPYSPMSQLPVLSHYNTAPEQPFYGLFPEGGHIGGGNGPVQRPKTLNDSKLQTMDGLYKQGVVNPNTLFNYLNYDQSGKKVGDFTWDEINYYLGSSPGLKSHAKGGSAYPVQSQLPVMNGYNASPLGAMSFYKQGGGMCIPCMFEHMKRMQQGGGTGYTFDQYYNDLNTWQNPSAQSVPQNIANYESQWIVPTIKNYQTTLNSALYKKYNLQQGQSPAQNQFLTAQEAQSALGGQQQYADYLKYVQGYQAYRARTAGTYQAPSQTAGTMDPNGEAYGYRHFGLFTLSPEQQQANQANASPALAKPGLASKEYGGTVDDDDDLDEMEDGGWIKSASDKMKKKGTKGTFTKYCGGKVTEECIKRGLASSNPTTRKRAAFAKAMRHIAKKKEGGDVPSQYEGLGYLQKKNSEFINAIAESFGMHAADQEDMDALHRHMFQQGGASTPLGTLYQTTSVDPMGTSIDLPPNPMWNTPDPGLVVPNQVQTVQMDPNQLEGRPITSAEEPYKRKKWNLAMTPDQRGNSILAGTAAIASILEKRNRAKQEEQFRSRMGTDQFFTPVSAGAASRGDYDTNSGMFRPNMMVPVQFPGGMPAGYGYPSYQYGGSYQQGGEYYMNDNDINQILAAGGQIEYLD